MSVVRVLTAVLVNQSLKERLGGECFWHVTTLFKQMRHIQRLGRTSRASSNPTTHSRPRDLGWHPKSQTQTHTRAHTETEKT